MPIWPCANFGRTSAPRLPQREQVKLGFVGEPDIVGPAVSVGFDVMAATVIAAIDQHIAHAGCAQLAEGDLLRVGSSWLAVLAHFDPSSIGEICDLHDLASGVIGGPFAYLFPYLEVA